MKKYKTFKEIIDEIVDDIIEAFKEEERIVNLKNNFDEYINNNYINWTIPKEIIEYE